MRQAPDSSDTTSDRSTGSAAPAKSVPAFADEPLVDYLLRALEECRALRRPLACRHGDVQFTIAPTMDASQVVAVWHAVQCVRRDIA